MTKVYKNKHFKNLVYHSRIQSIINKVMFYYIQIKFFLAFLYKCYKKNIIKKSKMIRIYNKLKIYLQNLKKTSYIEIEQKNIYKSLLTNKKFKSFSNLPWEFV